MPKHNNDDRRLIEDYLPIEAISAEARREKSVRKGHISTLHLWWARRPLVASRAAVFGALVPAGSAKPEFVAELCTYPGPKDTIKQAQRLILKAHAERLTTELGSKITVEDIEAGRAPRPKVLDMFAGGGAIPLEALRLGCEAYALDLNPVAHIIQLCTLVYPQKYGQPDPAAKGSAKDGSWAGLAAEVEHWGKWVLERVKKEIGDLYPPIPDPRAASDKKQKGGQLTMSGGLAPAGQDNKNMLTPVAYLWTRTVRCKNPACGGAVPLARQTWLAKKSDRYVALMADAETNRNKPVGEKKVRYHVVEATTEKGLGFHPEVGSVGGNVACPFCDTVVDINYVKNEGWQGRIGQQLMAIACTQPNAQGKTYLSADELKQFIPNDLIIRQRINDLCTVSGLSVPNESIASLPPESRDNTLGITVRPYGVRTWGDLFTPRQILCLLTFVAAVRKAEVAMRQSGYGIAHINAVTVLLAAIIDRLADFNSTLCVHNYFGSSRIAHTFGRQALPMVWDFAEANPFNYGSGGWGAPAIVSALSSSDAMTEDRAEVLRGSATELPWPDNHFDAVITDPPYYDNVPYSDISDFFYVWLKRTIGDLFPEHFATESTPKKKEAIADSGRFDGSKEKARQSYEQMMAKSFTEANRVLKPDGEMVVVYAHKTTLGWSTLVDALRLARFTVTEAWPLDTEKPGRLRAQESSALASSIFLIARSRKGNEVGSYERNVKPELETIVRERVDTLWAKGITGADLVIACVGAGLRAFTHFARVEYASGEEVPAEKFLGEVEGVVLDTLLEKLFGVPHSSVASVDAPTRFYVLWRYAYRTAAIDAGEAIIFAYPQGVELDGQHSLSSGPRALVEKQKSKYSLRDYTERGDDDKLGLPNDRGTAPLIDVLHRLLHLMENDPAEIPTFLDEAKPNLDQLLLVAQTLAGSALAGNGSGGGRSLIAARGAEAAALRKLTTNWKTVIGNRSML